MLAAPRKPTIVCDQLTNREEGPLLQGRKGRGRTGRGASGHTMGPGSGRLRARRVDILVQGRLGDPQHFADRLDGVLPGVVELNGQRPLLGVQPLGPAAVGCPGAQTRYADAPTGRARATPGFPNRSAAGE